jgi:hypothetical protein
MFQLSSYVYTHRVFLEKIDENNDKEKVPRKSEKTPKYMPNLHYIMPNLLHLHINKLTLSIMCVNDKIAKKNFN